MLACLLRTLHQATFFHPPTDWVPSLQSGGPGKGFCNDRLASRCPERDADHDKVSGRQVREASRQAIRALLLDLQKGLLLSLQQVGSPRQWSFIGAH